MRVGIAGLGLIGGSLGAALRNAGHEVMGYDINSFVCRRAEERDLVSVAASVDEMAAAVDVIVLAMNPLAVISEISRVAAMAQPRTVMTDVCSVKRPVVEAMNALPEGARAVGGHPMAGRARGGVEEADAELFRGAPWAVAPTDRSDPAALETVETIARDAGADPLRIGAAAHDRAVAATSHLPQLLSSALAAYLGEEAGSPLRGPGLTSMLRLAQSDEGLWTEILLLNRDEVGRRLDGFGFVLRDAAASIRRGDGAAVAALIARGREAAA